MNPNPYTPAHSELTAGIRTATDVLNTLTNPDNHSLLAVVMYLRNEVTQVRCGRLTERESLIDPGKHRQHVDAMLLVAVGTDRSIPQALESMRNQLVHNDIQVKGYLQFRAAPSLSTGYFPFQRRAAS